MYNSKEMLSYSDRRLIRRNNILIIVTSIGLVVFWLLGYFFVFH